MTSSPELNTVLDGTLELIEEMQAVGGCPPTQVSSYSTIAYSRFMNQDEQTRRIMNHLCEPMPEQVRF